VDGTDRTKDAAVTECAERLAARLGPDEATFGDCSTDFKTAYLDLLAQVRGLGDRYAFDRDGRPAAIAAVREALPVMERDLFDAVVDDHACEVAAIEEALYRMALAYGRRGRGPA
jgi:hypothetical protein